MRIGWVRGGREKEAREGVRSGGRKKGAGEEDRREERKRSAGERSGSGQRETWSGERADPLTDYPSRATTRPFPHLRSSSRPSGPSCPPSNSRRHVAAVHTDSDYPSQFENITGKHARTNTHHGRNQARRYGSARYTRECACMRVYVRVCVFVCVCESVCVWTGECGCGASGGAAGVQ